MKMLCLETICLVVLAVSSGYCTMVSAHFLATLAPTIVCDGRSNCVGEECLYTRSLWYNTKITYFSGLHRMFGCGPLEVDIIFPYAKNKSAMYGVRIICFTFNSVKDQIPVLEIEIEKPIISETNLVSCFQNCTLMHETKSSLLFVAGVPNDCAPLKKHENFTMYVPSRISELMCFSKEMCSGASQCRYKAKLTSKESSSIYSQGLQVLVSCGTLDAYLTCPAGDQTQFCSHDMKCYTYELFGNSSSNLTFNAMDVILKKPEDSEFRSTHVACVSEGQNCPMFSKTASSSSFAVGIPRFCFPWTGFDPETDVFLPSKTNLLVCVSRQMCFVGVCRCRSQFVNQQSGFYGGGVKIISDCGDLRVITSCPLDTNNTECYQTKTCYAYKSEAKLFHVMEITVEKLGERKNQKLNVECKFGKEDCPVFEETSSNVTFVISRPNNCYPEAVTAPRLES